MKNGTSPVLMVGMSAPRNCDLSKTNAEPLSQML